MPRSKYAVRLTKRQINLLNHIKGFWIKYNLIPLANELFEEGITEESKIYIQRFFTKLKSYKILRNGYKNRLKWCNQKYVIVEIDNRNNEVKPPAKKIQVSEFASGGKK